jgi:TRAP-type C4-dicarboxylate transport system permease small subunit
MSQQAGEWLAVALFIVAALALYIATSGRWSSLGLGPIAQARDDDRIPRGFRYTALAAGAAGMLAALYLTFAVAAK